MKASFLYPGVHTFLQKSSPVPRVLRFSTSLFEVKETETEEVKEPPGSGRTEIKSKYRRPRHSFGRLLSCPKDAPFSQQLLCLDLHSVKATDYFRNQISG
uniref:uncharacterized protein LOC108591112 n=1 Tax=Callithrix jacchus TaxID=9483 RepID=UPI0023DD435A|nr:uncharacterized protein LOC108591112 [Callithrix jacchus]XP_054109675.1 uncharacterized protein LOC108591112 [Callithrix jacchus]XP_054109676.1 uncharacterized protein LOC108591112 [Callithrix jacchus]